VRLGYDAIASRYEAWRVDGNPAEELVRDLEARLPDRSDVLELGCGNGRPGALVLAGRHDYTGVDFSRSQLARARALVGNASFLEADYTELAVEAESLDAVVAILTLSHVPRTEHAGLLVRIAGWLRRGGLLLASFGVDDTEGDVDPDWLGAPMYFSSFDAEANRRLIRKAGLRPIRDEVRTMEEEGHGPTRFLWILAAKDDR
jgi:SAM-dependent methyltransferase